LWSLSTWGRFRAALIIIEVEKNVATLDGYRERLQASILGIYAAACAHIELPMVPRATESFFRQGALAQAAFLVGTGVSIGIDVIIHVDEQNAVPTHDQAQHFAAPEVVEGRDFPKRHGVPLEITSKRSSS
jgi:hypothetical protein